MPAPLVAARKRVVVAIVGPRGTDRGGDRGGQTKSTLSFWGPKVFIIGFTFRPPSASMGFISLVRERRERAYSSHRTFTSCAVSS